MEIAFDYSQDTLLIDGISIPLDELRQYILLWHPDRVQPFLIKRIRTHGKTIFTYDWKMIFDTALESSIIEDFVIDRKLQLQ